MRRITHILLVTAFATSIAVWALFLNTGNVGAQLENSPWPMFRRDLQHTGLSPYDTSHVDGTVKWFFPITGGVESSPAIGADGTIYVSTWDNNLHAINPDGVYAINPDGTEKWHFATYGTGSSPAIGSDGTIYVGVAENQFMFPGIPFPYGTVILYAINPDGTKKWDFVPGGCVCGIFSSPTIGLDGTIYYGSGGDYREGWGGDRLCAINPDGTEKWHFTIGTGMTSSPAIGPDGTIYVGATGTRRLYAINPNGTEKWYFTTQGFVESSPAIGSDGTIYVGSGEIVDKNLYAINPDGTEKWHFTTGNYVTSTPAIGADGTIYVGSEDNNLYAINPNGTEKWHFNTRRVIEFYSPSIGADGTIYVGCSYDFYAINPNGTEKWHLQGVVAPSSPAIGADGTIYVSGWDGLRAIGGPAAEGGPENLPADTDNDGMSDTWENQYGLDPNTNDASQDEDEDGYTNLQEYQGGTNPTLASSYPGVTGGDNVPGGAAPGEGISIIYIIAGVVIIAVVAGVVLVLQKR